MTFKSLRTAEQEQEFRQLWAYLYEQVSIGKAKTGVVGGLAVTATTPSASGSVVVGAGLSQCQPSTSGGAFPMVTPADETFDVFTTNPMLLVSNPRNDIIVIDQTTGAVNILVGTPNATPSLGEQTVPNTAVPLARLRHLANATTIPTAQIDDLRVTILPAGAPSVGAWTTFNPAITSTGTAPVNLSVTGQYAKIGRKVTFAFAINIGASTSVGTGFWRVGLPFNVAAAGIYKGTVGLSATGTTEYHGALTSSAFYGQTLQILGPTASGNAALTEVGASGVAGVAWSSSPGGYLRGQITYQAIS